MKLLNSAKWAIFTLFILSIWSLDTQFHDLSLSPSLIYLDPIWHIIGFIEKRPITFHLIIFVLIIIATLFLGRFFCYYVCPLGSSLDLFAKIKGFAKKHGILPPSKAKALEIPHLNSVIFVAIVVAAVMGLNLAHLTSPVSISSALFGLFLSPIKWFKRGYLNPWLHLFFLLLPFLLAQKSHRTWCIHICPTGWLLGFISSIGGLRLIFSEACNSCGKCQYICTMNAIETNERKAIKANQCHLCLLCIENCPQHAIKFEKLTLGEGLIGSATLGEFTKERRQFLLGGLFGLAISGVATQKGVFRGDYIRSIMPNDLIRPPGALPEQTFELLCVRCGLCMANCPSNTLQPLGFQNGVLSLFTPVLVPRIGACYPDCNLCGEICPTGAIRKLDLVEKQWAKVGTAVITKERCIAWEWEKRCLVCDEACPYDAITMVEISGIKVLVPIVVESRCNGCGACEMSCPVYPQKAIQISPMGEIRLASGSYREEGKKLGFTLGLKTKGLATGQEMPPGFESD